MDTLSADLLEREAACSAILTTLRHAEGGAGSVLLLRGDPGIGKSRLLGWTAREATGRFLIVAAVGHEMETAFPYALVHQVAAGLRRVPRGPSPELVEASDTLRSLVRGAPVAAGSDRAPAYPGRAAIAYAFHWLLASVGEHQPLLLLLDDLHWSDPDSLEILRFSAWRARSAPLAIIAALRSWPPEATLLANQLRDAERAAVVDLSPLSTQATGRLLRRIVGAEISPQRAREAHALTGGNPLLVGEMGRGWQAGDDGAVPALRALAARRSDLVLSRLDGVPVESLRVLEAAAVLGDPCAVREALAIAGVDADAGDRALAPIAALHLFSSSGPLGAFHHPLLREMVYEAIQPARRRQLHRSAAELLRAESASAARIAAHVAIGAEPGDLQAVGDLRRAAQDASAVSAHESAAVYLRRAAELCPPGERRAELLHELGCAKQLADAHEEACRTFARAAQEAADAATDCRISQSWAFSLTILGESDAARERLQTAISRQAAADPLAAAEPAIALVVLEITARGVVAALRAGEQALAIAEASGDPIWPNKAKAAWGWAASLAAMPGALSLLLRIGEESPEASDRLEAIWGWSHGLAAGMAGMVTGQYAQALRLLERRVEVVRATTHQNARIWSFALLAVCYWQMGRLRDSYRLCGEWAVFGETFPWATSLARLCEGFTLIEMGEFDGAAEALERARELAIRTNFQFTLATCQVANAILTARRGGIQEAAAMFLEILPMVDRAQLGEIDIFHWMREAAEVLVQGDELDAAEGLLDRIGSFLSSSEFPRLGLRGVALRCTALLAARRGDPGRAEEAFRQAVALHADSHERVEHGRTLLAYGSWMRRSGRLKEARALLRTAEALFERCGSPYWQRRAEAEYGAARGRRRQADGGRLSRLTPQEHRVTELVAQDYSNRQIAALLLISPKTLETHLSHIYGKLDAGSRAELKTIFEVWAKEVGAPAEADIAF